MSWVNNIKSFFGRTDPSDMDEHEAAETYGNPPEPNGEERERNENDDSGLKVPPPASRPAPRNRRDRGKLPHHRMMGAAATASAEGSSTPEPSLQPVRDVEQPVARVEEASPVASRATRPEAPAPPSRPKPASESRGRDRRDEGRVPDDERRDRSPARSRQEQEPLRSEEIQNGVEVDTLDPAEFGGLDPVDSIERMIDGLGLDGEIDALIQIEGGYLIALHSEDPGRLIGRHGAVLNELQFLLNRMVQKGARGSVPRLILDVDGYRDRQEERLVEMALDAAAQVRERGRPIRLEPLNAYERRIVHNALKSDPEVETYSPSMPDPDGRKQITIRVAR